MATCQLQELHSNDWSLELAVFTAVYSGREKTRSSRELNVRGVATYSAYISIFRCFFSTASKQKSASRPIFTFGAIWLFYLESLAAPGEPRGQRVCVGDDDQSQEDSQRQQPDERPPPAIVAAAVVTG